MAVIPRGRSFMADFKLGPVRYRPTFQTYHEAEAHEMQSRADFALGKPYKAPGAGSAASHSITTIKALAEHCGKKQWTSSGSAKHNEQSRDSALKFAEWCGPAMSAGEALTEEKVEEYVEYLEDLRQNSGSTVNRQMAVLSVLLKEALRLSLVPAPFKLPKRAEGQSRLRVFTEAEERAILTTLQDWSEHDFHDLFIFLCDTGVRPGREAYELAWEDFEGRRIVLEGAITKNSSQRVLTATPRVLEAVERMRAKYADLKGPFAWCEAHKLRYIWLRLRGHYKWLGTAVPYTYRHTCASRLVRGGADLYRVQIWMGHKTLAMTQRYAKFAPKHLEELADILEGPKPVAQRVAQPAICVTDDPPGIPLSH